MRYLVFFWLLKWFYLIRNKFDSYLFTFNFLYFHWSLLFQVRKEPWPFLKASWGCYCITPSHLSHVYLFNKIFKLIGVGILKLFINLSKLDGKFFHLFGHIFDLLIDFFYLFLFQFFCIIMLFMNCINFLFHYIYFLFIGLKLCFQLIDLRFWCNFLLVNFVSSLIKMQYSLFK